MNEHDEHPSGGSPTEDGQPLPPGTAEEGVPRRQFLQEAAQAGAAVTLGSLLPAQAPGQARPPARRAVAPTAAGAVATPTVLRVNGTERRLALEPRVTLLDALREAAGLTGTKKGCDHGQCGACTVLVDGRRVNSCLTFAIMHTGAEITTIEGLARGEELHPVQAAFIEHDGFQCGFCTPGQICSAVALLTEARAGTISAVTANVADTAARVELTDDEIRERMSGNLCRCGAYPGIVAAVRQAARTRQA